MLVRMQPPTSRLFIIVEELLELLPVLRIIGILHVGSYVRKRDEAPLVDEAIRHHLQSILAERGNFSRMWPGHLGEREVLSDHVKVIDLAQVVESALHTSGRATKHKVRRARR